MILFAAFLLGVASGLRVFTAPAVLYLSRGGIAGIVLAIAAVAEYVADALPQIPSRLALPSIVLRPLSGIFVGWMLSAMHGQSAVAGAVLGLLGALAGTYGGYAARRAAIAVIGAIPAAIAEDVVAIALAAFAVTR